MPELHRAISVEGELCIEFALEEDQEDRVRVGAYDLHDLVASQFSNDSLDRVQQLGVFRVTFERLS